MQQHAWARQLLSNAVLLLYAYVYVYSTCMTCAMPARAHRQSKLTAALRDAIGGNANTVMIANLWPEEAHLEECVSTLRFAARVRCLQTDAQVGRREQQHRPALWDMQPGEQHCFCLPPECCKVWQLFLGLLAAASRAHTRGC